MSEGVKPVDVTKLYRVEMYTDSENGDIRALWPVYTDAWSEEERPRAPRFFSTVTIAINGRPIPVNFEIRGASTLEEAIAKFVDEANAAADRFVNGLQERERQAPRVIVPTNPRMQ